MKAVVAMEERRDAIRNATQHSAEQSSASAGIVGVAIIPRMDFHGQRVARETVGLRPIFNADRTVFGNKRRRRSDVARHITSEPCFPYTAQ